MEKIILIHRYDVKNITCNDNVVTDIKLKRKYKDRGLKGKAIIINTDEKIPFQRKI